MYQIASEQHREELHKKYGHRGGVYKLQCFEDVKVETIVPISRVLGVDTEGVLYIGKAAAGLGRVGDLVKSLSPAHESEGHHAGLRYAKNPKLSQMFPFERLCITFTPADDPDVAEREMIQDYIQMFGEVPPLNANEP
jgi:hypothetical protein